MAAHGTTAMEWTRALIAAVVALGRAMFAVSAAAEDLARASQEDPFASLSPVDDTELDAARGRAVLPDGLTVEVTALMRVLVDGQEIAQSVLSDASAAVSGQASLLPLTSAPYILQNSLNGISIERYREINFRISNLPISLEPRRFIPPPVIGTDLLP